MKKLVFHFPHVRILGNNHCGNTRSKAFKRCSAKQYLLCHCGCSERVVSSFAHQIQSEYYFGNIYVSIKVVSLDHFSAPTHTETAGTPQARTHYSVFHSFFYYARKQDSATTISHSKCISECFNQRNIMHNTLN